jgi:hypothetical protein
VATTPSAATRIAKKAGYPVQIKAWGPDQPSEEDGCAIEPGVESAAEARRAFAMVCERGACEAVIVRETPPRGRELRVRIRRYPELGLVLHLEQRGQSQPAAALVPLRAIDARAIARRVVASRADDPDPDWQSLAELLILASHLVAAEERVRELDLAKIVVGARGDGSTVVDAFALLDE